MSNIYILQYSRGVSSQNQVLLWPPRTLPHNISVSFSVIIIIKPVKIGKCDQIHAHTTPKTTNCNSFHNTVVLANSQLEVQLE